MKLQIPYWTSRSLHPDWALQIGRDMDRFFDDFPPTNFLTNSASEEFSPATEITESDESFLLSVDLPGIKNKDIKIEVTGDILSISGERKKEERSEKHRVQRLERSYGFFQKSFTLPANVNAEKVEARFENGVLELHLPKTAVAQSRKIDIQSPVDVKGISQHN